ncbi:MAG: hypothetical protein H7338_08315 [Candidatus Sericytochromatia bacterium]|nr:hypothetical protein [Candidatus Sericytochromatia bacterium]
MIDIDRFHPIATHFPIVRLLAATAVTGRDPRAGHASPANVSDQAIRSTGGF